MMRHEFEQRTGFIPSEKMYTIIEQQYMISNMDKDAFCEAYKTNADGLATRIQKIADKADWEENIETANSIGNLESRIAELEKALEREQEWKPYEDKYNVSQEDYEKLASQPDTEEMSDEKAKDLLYSWFGFAMEKIHILHSIPIYEVNRHHILREIGEKERHPLYNATDWNYIRFDCGRMSYELDNGTLRRFSD